MNWFRQRIGIRPLAAPLWDRFSTYSGTISEPRYFCNTSNLGFVLEVCGAVPKATPTTIQISRLAINCLRTGGWNETVQSLIPSRLEVALAARESSRVKTVSDDPNMLSASQSFPLSHCGVLLNKSPVYQTAHAPIRLCANVRFMPQSGHYLSDFHRVLPGLGPLKRIVKWVLAPRRTVLVNQKKFQEIHKDG